MDAGCFNDGNVDDNGDADDVHPIEVDDLAFANPAEDPAGFFEGIGLPPDTHDEWEEAAAADAAVDALPFFDATTHQVHDGLDATAPIIGRIKPLRVGMLSECISMYCRKHGCAQH